MFSGIDQLEAAIGEFGALAGFAENPFSERSLALVATRFPPVVVEAYRRAARFWATIPSRAGFASFVQHPRTLFDVEPSPTSQGGSIRPPELALQVGIVEEWLRDALDAKPTSDRWGTQNALTRAQSSAALRHLRLHDALLLALAGLYEVAARPRRISFALTSSGRKSMIRRHWAMMLERGSQFAFHQAIASLVASFKPEQTSGRHILDEIPDPIWAQLELLFMDRFFSFGAGVAEAYPRQDVVKRLRAYCRWFAVLEVCREAGEPVLELAPDRARSVGLDLQLLAELEADRRSATHLDKGIQRANEGLTLGGVSLAHAIEVGKHVALPDTAYKDLADWFQEGFSIEYLQAYCDPEDYLVRPGFKRAAEGGRARFDCDLAIYDRQRNLFFFVQTKFKRASRLATVSDEIRALTHRNSAVTKGFDQIVTLRSRIDEVAVVDAIRGRFPELEVDAAALVARSKYLVVHNIPEFNGLVRDGVVMYEWNMFRNLLARGQMTVTRTRMKETTSDEMNAPDVLALEDVDKVFEYLGGGLGLNQRSITEAFEHYSHARLSFEVPRQGGGFAELLKRRTRVETPLL